MAIIKIEKTIIPINGSAEMKEAVTVGTDGATVMYDAGDHRIALIIGGGDATIKAGDGLQATDDLLVSYASGKTRAVVLESGKFLNLKGEKRGSIYITGATATVQAIVLP